MPVEALKRGAAVAHLVGRSSVNPRVGGLIPGQDTEPKTLGALKTAACPKESPQGD